jgi:uncharacterized protein (TIGR02118 family)
MGFLQRRPDVSQEDFVRHWREVHGPLIARLPGVRQHHQNSVIDREQRGIDYRRGPVTFDAISEAWFDDEPALQSSLTTDAARAVTADEPNLAEEMYVVTAAQNVVIPTPTGAPLLKRMSIIKRRDDVTPEAFRHEWCNMHALLVKRLPQVKGYAQNLILERTRGQGARVSREELPIDGVVELWFEDVQRLHSAFRSDAGITLMTHAREFIAEISTVLVKVYKVV